MSQIRSAYNKELELAVYETIGRSLDKGGRYSYQEDEVAYGALADFEKLSAEQKALVLKKTFEVLQEKYGKSAMGSTAIVSVINQDEIYTAYVGDSASFLVIVNNTGEAIACKRLNKRLHEPMQTDEYKRLMRAKKTNPEILISDMYGEPRLFGRHSGLLVSRAIGDNDIPGLSHENDLDILSLKNYLTETNNLEKIKLYILVGCDGLTEGIKAAHYDLNYVRLALHMTEPEAVNFLDQMQAFHNISDEQYVQQLININKDKSFSELPEALVKTAMAHGSCDNISVVLSEIKADNNHPKFLAVFDGHGSRGRGNPVSQNLGQYFGEILQKQIKLLVAA